ncbi:hypothetical protein LIG30_2902 [Burkholderia sp. lig30]|jgi:hypothetical protein|uniref:hypothetical protein n=1 Tax=Burkholderia sp. lig30 TaxID=1192124 RepID=UPI000461C788|nr:hypothetical protein LIG30_2902 [Burkholderia sp. lig30]
MPAAHRSHGTRTSLKYGRLGAVSGEHAAGLNVARAAGMKAIAIVDVSRIPGDYVNV